MKPVVAFDTFASLDMMVGKVIGCVQKEGSDKLLRLTVDFGAFQRTIFAGMAKWYTAQDFEGKSFIFLVNLEPKKIMDEYSEGMLLAVDGEKPTPLQPSLDVKPGTTVR